MPRELVQTGSRLQLFARFQAFLTIFELTLFEEGLSRKILRSDLSLAMFSTVPMRRIFDLGPRCAEGACPDRVTTAAFRQTRACARARRARARIIFIYFD